MVALDGLWRAQQRAVSSRGIAYIRRPGAGPAVLLIHGVGLRAESWAAQLAALDCRARFVALDLPGHGGSAPLAARVPGLGDYRDALAYFVEEVIGGPVVFCGHSLGGLLALELAVARPGLTLGVAALNTVYRREPAAVQAVKARALDLQMNPASDIADAPIRRWFGQNPEGPARKAAEACRAWLMDCDRQGYAEAYRVFAENDGPPEEAVAGLDCPALFLTGSEDPNSTPEMSAQLANLAPRGRCAIVDGAAHMAQMTHREEVNAALSDLIADCAAAAVHRRIKEA